MSKSGFFWNDKKSRFSLIVKPRFRNTISKEEKFIVLMKETNNFDEINNFVMYNFWNKIGIFAKLVRKVSVKLKRFQGSTFDTIARRKLVEDQDTILELTGKIQELQNEINCMNDSRDFQDADQYAVDNPTLPVNQRFSHHIQTLVEC